MRILAGALFAALLVQAGCGSPEDPAPRPVMKKPAPPSVAQSPVPAPPAPAPVEPPALPPPRPIRPTPVPEQGPLPGGGFDPAISTSSFSFRTMDHQKADVFINGHLESGTPCHWSVTLNTAFDPKIPVPAWPPPGTKYAGSGTRKLDDGTPYSTVELWIEGGHYELDAFEATRKRYPHLVDGEQIVYVRAKWGQTARTGALRIRVVGRDGALYRWIDYVAWHSDEDENASLFKHALWFYAVRPE